MARDRRKDSPVGTEPVASLRDLAVQADCEGIHQACGYRLSGSQAEPLSLCGTCRRAFMLFLRAQISNAGCHLTQRRNPIRNHHQPESTDETLRTLVSAVLALGAIPFFHLMQSDNAYQMFLG